MMPPLWLALAGCGVEPVALPSAQLNVYVQRWDAAQECFATCAENSLPTVAIEGTCEATTDLCSELALGDTRLRLLAEYAGVVLEDNLAVAAPTTAAYDDETALAVSAGGWLVDDVAGVAWLRQEILLPVLDADSLWFRVTGAPGFVGDSPRFDLVTNAPAVSILDCAGLDPCELPAGVGKLDVEVVGPRYASEALEVRAFVGGVPMAPIAAKFEPAVGGARVARLALAIPDDIGEELWIEAGAGSWLGRSAVASLRRPEPIQIGVTDQIPTAAVAVSALVPPRRAGGDVDACREVYVAVRAPDVPESRVVKLTTSHGAFQGGAANVELEVDATGFAWTTLAWPATSADEIVLTATADDLSDATHRWELEDVHFDTASVLGPTGPIDVGTTGSQSGTVVGWLAVPFEATMEDDPAVSLVVTATADTTTEPPCEDPLTETHIRCDRDRVLGGSPGGCRLTPGGIAVDAAGTFSVALESGQCFVGEISVEVWAHAYETRGACVGEGAVTTDAVSLGAATVVYEAAAP